MPINAPMANYDHSAGDPGACGTYIEPVTLEYEGGFVMNYALHFAAP